ncbi:MAG: hypothetical protein CME21_19880 [Gemmatimonadetes bacterium]|jgi:hypothetical protein|nr:hypothetical protein [Gemmatimonadota bacterium]
MRLSTANGFLSIALGLLFLCGPTHSQNGTTGRVALGAFVPTGDDSEVSSTSVVVQLTGDVQIFERIGIEGEFNWVPINLESTVGQTSTLIEARQVSALGGLRFASSGIEASDNTPVAYVSARLGFSRLAVRSDTTTSVPGWIGRAVDKNQKFPPNWEEDRNSKWRPRRATENAFVLSPRVGILLRPRGSAVIDLSIAPSFLFDGGEVTTQVVATFGFGLFGTID